MNLKGNIINKLLEKTVNKIKYVFTSAIESKKKKAMSNKQWKEKWTALKQLVFFFSSECHKSETKLKVSVNYNKHGEEMIFWWSQ